MSVPNGQTLAPMIQGVNAPNVVIDNRAFYAATRRLRFPMQSAKVFSGIGTTDSIQLKQTGIVAALEVRVAGNITFGGTIGTTTASYEWPFNLVQNFKLSANGQSNLISARGLTIRALDFVTSTGLNDRGVSKTFGAVVQTQGTLALGCDDWGTLTTNIIAPGANVAAVGVYTVDLTYFIPVAADQISLIGAVYAQSSATNLTLEIQWATQAQAFSAVGGAATVAYNLTWDVTGLAYSIPQVGNNFVVPDLSQFHQVTETRVGGLTQGVNEIKLPGVGTGRKWLRTLFNVYSSAAPLPVTDANFSQLAWAFGGNDVPETYSSGGKIRAWNERITGVDLGRNWGLVLWDFASTFALRDVVDMGSTSDLRVLIGLVNSPTTGYTQVAQETLFSAATGA